MMMVCISKWKTIGCSKFSNIKDISFYNTKAERLFQSILEKPCQWNKSYLTESSKNSVYLNSLFPVHASKWSLHSLSYYYISGTGKEPWEQR